MNTTTEKLSLAGPESFRAYLVSEFERRKRMNTSYSLRSFAKQLEINHAALSLILRGKRSIGEELLIRLAHKLGISSESVTRKIYQDDQSMVELAIDQAITLSDWHYDAILEVVNLKDFVPNISWVAKKLGLSNFETEEAINRLVRLKMLVITDDGKWIAETECDTSIPTEVTNEAFRKLQSRILEKSLHSIDNVLLEKRSHTSLTFAFTESQIPEVKEFLKKCRRDFIKKFINGQEKMDSVYQLQLSFFPLTTEFNESQENQ